MGEVRVDATLTNVVDAVLAKVGQRPADSVRVETVDAMVDTGSVTATVPRDLAERLGLFVKRQRRVQLADASSQVVDVVGPITFEILGRSTEDEAAVIGDEVLIGQVILEKLDLLVDCADHSIYPNPAHPDGPVLKLK